MAEDKVNALVDRFLKGDRFALARILTHAENRSDRLPFIFDRIYPRVGRAKRIGITGPPGAGKSTLVEAMSSLYSAVGFTVGVIAVDPTSPFSGGALLGDRVRMQRLNLNEGVFVRSMASRGSVGGLARASDEAADVMDAFGFDLLLIETVGVGQSEVDVASLVDSTVVVLFPGAGDVIQAMKAGLMEIADLFVVNKADQEGADLVIHEIGDSLALKDFNGRWQPPILKCSAREEQGLEELKDRLEEHYLYLTDQNILQERRTAHVKQKVKLLLNDTLRNAIWDEGGLSRRLDALLHEKKTVSPYRLADTLQGELSDIIKKVQGGE
jgi:LAO/AO transport system kinase